MNIITLPKRCTPTATQKQLRALTQSAKAKLTPAQELAKAQKAEENSKLVRPLDKALSTSPILPGYACEMPFSYLEEVAPGIVKPHTVRFDRAIWLCLVETRQEVKLAIEVEGGTWGKRNPITGEMEQGRHSRGKGYSDDCRKYNHAIMAGWTLLRYPSDQLAKQTIGLTIRQIEQAYRILAHMSVARTTIIESEGNRMPRQRRPKTTRKGATT